MNTVQACGSGRAITSSDYDSFRGNFTLTQLILVTSRTTGCKCLACKMMHREGLTESRTQSTGWRIMTTESNWNGATTLSRPNFSRHAWHVTILSWCLILHTV